ncbi:zinc/cadmium/mercury/lead-transporting ATPase [Photobacterium sp. SDRW27]|uniref:zinc/cadmium/mercury/lead-transporting ATPase n=1 Tax=Photobacterium obscurum TaxID=2829490 RepID=UPI002242E74B|nr:zinc/cadmium/mercury/lead-transporting ATPase [Photobacterium obscurum]MCW8330786.1 zinc/cadmium/mercury/lead-transporting ATPase [Photobacterium obscurum]
MCAQCNNKKPHIHSVKPATASATSVKVESGATQGCCSATTCTHIQSTESENNCESGSDDDPAAGRRLIHSSSILADSGVKPAVFSMTSASSALHSKKTKQSFSHSLDMNHQAAPSEEAASCSGSCCESAVLLEDEQAVEEALNQSTHSKTLSWKVQNMDCPSCASKLEKAIFSIVGIETAKVMFATQKLVVSCRSEDMAATIEQKAKQTGFPLVSARSKDSETEGKSLLQQNTPVIIIALMMLLSFLVSRSSETYGLIAFTLTTLLGLLPIVKKAIALAKGGTPFSIETLMSVAAIGALYLGETAEAAMVLLLFLIGEQLEGYASSRARSGVKALMDLVPEQATVIHLDGSKTKVAAEDLKKGDIIEVAPGGRLPADAELLNTIASFDESALTGESVPVERQPGEQVMAGSLVSDKVVRLKIVSEQGENAIDRILHLIEDAESRKAPLERFMDRFSRWYTPAMIVLAALVIVVPPLMFAQSWDEWIYKGLTLLLIACPCALVISIPAAITSGLAAAARRGALIKGGATLEQLGHIEMIAFDKTGTLTQGKPVMTDIVSWDGDNNKLLRQSAAVEAGSLHPLAQAVVKAAEQRGWPVTEAEDREALPGRGIQGVVDGDTLLLAAADRLPESVVLSEEQQSDAHHLESEGKTLVVAVRNGLPVGMIAWRDNLRDDTPKAIKSLKAMGIQSVMLTGDNPRAAAAIAKEIDIDYRAGLLPADKVSEVERANLNAKVAMVGDGINDAPAMKTASVGIAMGGGADVALETADAALTHNRVSELPTMIALSRATLVNIRQNIFLALGLKGVFLVTTLFGLTGLWVAVLADSGATALVTLNALRLLRFKAKTEE